MSLRRSLTFVLLVFCASCLFFFVRGCRSGMTASELRGRWIDDREADFPVRWEFQRDPQGRRVMQVAFGELGIVRGTWAVDGSRLQIDITEAPALLKVGAFFTGRVATGPVEFEIVELSETRLVLAPPGATDPSQQYECRRVP